MYINGDRTKSGGSHENYSHASKSHIFQQILLQDSPKLVSINVDYKLFVSNFVPNVSQIYFLETRDSGSNQYNLYLYTGLPG